MGFLLPLIPLLISLYGVVYCAIYSAFIGESCEEIGDTRWFLQRRCH